MAEARTLMAEAATHSPEPPLRGDTREVLLLAYPVVLSGLAQTVMGLVDMLFMGWVSTAAQAGLGLGNTLSWATTCFFVGTITVVNTAVAQRFGAGQARRCGEAGWSGLWLAAMAGLFTLVVSVPLTPRLAGMLGAPVDVADIARRYATIRIAGMALSFFEVALQSFMRGIGDTRTPMKVAFGMMLLNVPLNYWLIFGGLGVPPLGPEGAAYATALATAAGVCALFVVYLRRSWRERFGTGWPGRLDRAELAELLRVGLPIGAHWLLEMLTWTIFTMAVARFGTVPMAAHNVVLQIMHVSFMPGLGISIAATTLVGQALGAERPALARRSAWIALRLGSGYMASMGLFFYFGGRAVAGWFSGDAAVVQTAERLFVLAACFQFFDGAAMVAAGVLRGAALTRLPLVAMLCCAVGLLLPGFWLFGIHLDGGVLGAWGGATGYVVVLGVIMLWVVRQGSWLERAQIMGRAHTASS